MKVSRKHQIITGIVWLFIFSIIFYFAYEYFPTRPLNWESLLILFALMFVTMLLPIQIQGVSISLERWITLTVFLQYGMFAELIFVQLAMLILLFSEKTSLPLNHKFFVNSLVFSITSLVSASVYYLTGGMIHSLSFIHVFIYSSIYAITYTLVNNLLLKFYFKTQKLTFSLVSRGAIWDYVSVCLMVPFSVSLYFLTEYLGDYSVFLISIPFLSILIASRMYNHSNDRQEQLSIASEIGHELADQLLYDEVLQTYLEKLKGIIPFEDGYIIDLRSEKMLIPLLAIEDGGITKQVKKIQFKQGKMPDDGLNLSHTEIFNYQKEIKNLINIGFTPRVRTVMTVPIIRDQVTEGFLIFTSERKNVFRTEDIQMIDVLTSYFAISAQKARIYEQTLRQSERCGLTKLHNYRYLDQKLEEAANEFQASPTEGVSVIMLDIDYFKRVNDTYGHESGNIILIELANLLTSFLKEKDILARYGGEEFVFILHDCSKEEAIGLAEKIRAKVEETYFTIIPDLSNDPAPIDIQITISLGVASIPEDGKTAKNVIRSADRALYIGGKQSGRNRVGVLEYEKELHLKV